MIWTAAFWKGVGERALKTFIATTIAQLGVGAVGVIPTMGLGSYNWLHIASVDVVAVLVSFGIALGNASFTAGATAQADAAALVAVNVNKALAATAQIPLGTVHPTIVPAPADPGAPAAGTEPPVEPPPTV